MVDGLRIQYINDMTDNVWRGEIKSDSLSPDLLTYLSTVRVTSVSSQENRRIQIQFGIYVLKSQQIISNFRALRHDLPNKDPKPSPLRIDQSHPQ